MPGPFPVRSTASSYPSHFAAAFAAHEGDHFAVRHEAQRRLVRMAGHVEMRDDVIVNSVAATHQLQLPFGWPGLYFARLRRLLRGSAGSLLCVIRNAVSLSLVPGDAPQPFAFAQHT